MPKRPAAADEPQTPPVPPWFVAAEDLYVFANVDGAGAPAVAYRAGDTHVPADLIEQWGWQDKVRAPEGFGGQAEETATVTSGETSSPAEAAVATGPDETTAIAAGEE